MFYKPASMLFALLTLTMFAPLSSLEAKNDGLRLHIEVVVKQGQEEVYDTAWKKLAAEAQRTGFPFYIVANANQNKRLMVVSMERYADVDEMEAAWKRVAVNGSTEIRQAFADVRNNVAGSYQYFGKHDLSLSYAPPGSYSGPFHRIENLSFEIADRGKMTSLLKTRKAAWEKAGIKSAFHVIWGSYGSPGYRVSILTSAPTKEDHARIEREITAKVDAEEDTFRAGLWSIVTDQEVDYWEARLDLRVKNLR